MKKIFTTVILSFVFLLVGCNMGPEAKTFEGSGITVELTEAFIEKDVIQAALYLESTQHIFMGNPEDKALVVAYGADTLDEYIELVLQVSNKSDSEILHYEDDDTEFYYAYYENSVSGQDFGYMLICMEGEDNYYTLNFGCRLNKFEGNKEQFLAWGKTIVVE